jgi:hypothetical protein
MCKYLSTLMSQESAALTNGTNVTGKGFTVVWGRSSPQYHDPVIFPADLGFMPHTYMTSE